MTTNGLKTYKPTGASVPALSFPKPSAGRRVQGESAVLAYRARMHPDKTIFTHMDSIQEAETEADRLVRKEIVSPDQVVALTVKDLFDRFFDDARDHRPRTVVLIPSGDAPDFDPDDPAAA